MGILLLSILFAVAASGELVRYDSYRLYRIEIATPPQLKSLQQLELFPDGVSTIYSLGCAAY